MPYIKQKDRKKFKQLLSKNIDIDNPGELNYLISKVVNIYTSKRPKSYIILNEVIGVLECAKLELYRSVISPYEDEKIKENGDLNE